jgi:hypothetical protein
MTLILRASRDQKHLARYLLLLVLIALLHMR